MKESIAADITGDEDAAEEVGECPSDPKNAGDLVDGEHRRQAIEVAFGVSGGTHGRFRRTPM